MYKYKNKIYKLDKYNNWYLAEVIEQEEFTPHGYLCTCNFGGIEIEIHPSGDSLRWRYNFGEEDPNLNTDIKEAEIQHVYDDETGETQAGFWIGEEPTADFYSLSEFMRIK